ncbi:TetR/AcrR family transcriptional regulator [Simiduia sp. 21SJ11W-1]|uniref:TetR/AcrR family transcriptional regulator n=1 Tax=Simiduia sp. 21SJ11W-1 TaxID=2909669 RepID=UPI00209F8BE7|nr:TetR/AcrR family transcriptional regulator [Simiduia sp. 21SJ11W-1]UTA46546.1 TetR/AcrR family transcriptional regulator [Simiduia sp. 21SJ11W-1]
MISTAQKDGPVPVSPRDAHKQDMCEALLRSGHSIVAKAGFSALSMAAIAGQANMATGNLYRYFKDKAALSVAIFERATEHEMHAVFECVNHRAPPVLQLEMLLTAFLQRSLANPQLAYALIAEPVAPEVEQARGNYRRRWAKRFAAVIADGIAQGQLAQQPVMLAATALVGAVAEPLSVAPEQQTFDAIQVDELVAFCLRALRL